MSEATRSGLIGHARASFAANGFAATSIDEVAAAAGATKGAVYHHFDGKIGLFEAVVREIHAELDARVEEAHLEAANDPARDPWNGLIAMLRTYLECLLDPGVRRILLVESPAALDGARERALDRELTLRPLHAHLGALQGRGALEGVDVEALAHVVAGAATEIALWMGESDDPSQSLDRGLSMLERVLDAMRAPRKKARR